MKRKIVSFILSISLLSLAGCAGTDTSVMGQGYAAMEEGDYVTAIAIFDRATGEEQVTQRDMLRAKGIAYLGNGNYDKAIQNFEDALRLSNGIVTDTDIDTSIYLAIAQYKQGMWQEAMDTFNYVIDFEPKSASAHYLRGKLELIKGDKDAALNDFDEAVLIEPGDYDAYIRICEDLRESGYTDESNEYIQKAMAVSSRLSSYNRGVLEYYLGNYTDARNDLEEARKKNALSENGALYLGRTYEALGDVEYAINVYEEGLAANPGSNQLCNQLVLTKMAQKDYKGAIDIIDAALSGGSNGNSQSLMYNRAVAYEYLYDFKSAAQYMKEYLESYPDDEKAKREYVFLSTR